MTQMIDSTTRRGRVNSAVSRLCPSVRVTQPQLGWGGSESSNSHAHSTSCCRTLDRRGLAPVPYSKGSASPKQQR